ncbi:hypothetical protein PsorP6_014216 [Peronosclerospora sorghi]|uniref:Uncharacterized protein n=1 Tax=Peronosclerospora sorghi TaxID=230839 RepID=A0ACC0VFI1_9STRA|nr:hypothetical protein PsorP6_014216 [Peronosclerospora sorghi]
MDRCVEEISTTVLDAGEPISYRTLGIRSHVSASVSTEALTRFSAENNSVQALHLLIRRLAPDNDDRTSETSRAKRDPRARLLCLSVESQAKPTDDVLFQQVYALHKKPIAATNDETEATAIATACWAQERQVCNDVLRTVAKNAPLSLDAKALYASDISCAEAIARLDVGGDQGEETVSAFDALSASGKKENLSSKSSSSLFQSNSTKRSHSSRANGDSKTTSTTHETKTLDMSNVLTVDSDDEEDKEMDSPMFVKASKNKRIISDDDEDEEETAPPVKVPSPPPRKSRNIKRKLNASLAESKKVNHVGKVVQESEKQAGDFEDEAENDLVEEPVVATKRRVLVAKTRIDEQGYMVTEKTYEEVELTAEEIEAEKMARKKNMEKKKQLAADKAAKAKKELRKQNGPPKQRDLRSFFSTQ